MRCFLLKDGLQTILVDASTIYNDYCTNVSALTMHRDIKILELVLEHPNIIFKSKTTELKTVTLGVEFNSTRQTRLGNLLEIASEYQVNGAALLVYNIHHGRLNKYTYVDYILFDHTRYNQLMRCKLLDDIIPTL